MAMVQLQRPPPRPVPRRPPAAPQQLPVPPLGELGAALSIVGRQSLRQIDGPAHIGQRPAWRHRADHIHLSLIYI